MDEIPDLRRWLELADADFRCDVAYAVAVAKYARTVSKKAKA